ncbi:serine/threonine-protein kinase [Mycolicibacterium sphagni]|uniref:non-specific serine/threonine protein kinase n=1 Tax=Mycolicibacterium sphagni TaxID=1786 RepID=A0A255DEW4_9MYCO|nr:serine/threonine-protein kinase [Mycolicibacterium sphagni]OYN75785.1 hypothetical protein CG716_24500 [Mycolicibacterium sphagni]
MDRTPASIGGFAIESVLGTGGMSTVYLARDSRRLVALKVFNSGCPSNSILVHPGIVPVYDRGEHLGMHWLAMEYVAGGDADSELRSGRMPPERAVRIVSEVGEALDFAHAQGVLHGDVKPSNFLLAERDRVLLADFGAAPFVENGSVLASAAYASPEMLRGKEIDSRSDIYSLGCSLFRLLTGKPPFFDAGSKDAVVQSHLRREPPQATRYAPWLPQAIDAVIGTAMAKDPDARYQNPCALADEAAAALTD